MECSRASSRVHKKRRDIKNEISHLSTLIKNQEDLAARRLTYITRDAAKAERLREAIAKKQTTRSERNPHDTPTSQGDSSGPPVASILVVGCMYRV